MTNWPGDLSQLEQQALQVLDGSLEAEKEHNDFLSGVASIEEAMRSGKIECRVYAERKFHAKIYITHGRLVYDGCVLRPDRGTARERA